MRHNRSWNPSSRANLGVLSALFALLVPTALGAQEPAPSTGESKVDPIATALLEAHNKERARENLAPLVLESKLEAAARAHARDMADHDKMTHEGSDASTPSQRVVRAGYRYLVTGENVAQGYREVEPVMEGWMNSPPHKKNILGDFTQMGVGRAESREGKPFWCVDFGKPLIPLDPAVAAADLVKRLNAERASAKRPDLTVDTRLARAAEKIAAELAKKKGQGGTPTRMEGLDERRFQELAMTTAVGQPDAEAVVKSLLDNSDYKARILGKSSKVGVGYATADDGIPYWSMILAVPARQ